MMKYLKNSYLKEYVSEIIFIGKDYIVLKDTIFHPKGGGQPADIGLINEEKVTRVTKENNQIKHYINNIKNFKIGQKVNLKIDWKYRYYLMKSHSAEHLFFGIIKSLDEFAKVIKINLNYPENEMFIETNLNIVEILNAVNKIYEKINQNLKITYNTKVLEDIKDVRIKIDRIDSKKIRVVSIGNFDKSACIGTHLNNSKEISDFIITKINKMGIKKYKINFKVDKEAKKEMIQNSNILLNLNYSSNILKEKTLDYFLSLIKINEELKQKLHKINNKFLMNKKFTPKKGMIIEEFNKLNNKDLIKLAVKLAKDNTVVFLNDNTLIISGKNTEKIFDLLSKKYQIKGGGQSNLKIGKILKSLNKQMLINDLIN